VARPKKARFGFGSQSAEMPFSEAVTESLKAASSAAGVDLIVLDNRYDGSTALHNVDEFARNRVDLVIEFRIDQHVAPVLADKIDAAGYPTDCGGYTASPRDLFWGQQLPRGL
jgi:ribose transport system substrate-binding protein